MLARTDIYVLLPRKLGATTVSVVTTKATSTPVAQRIDDDGDEGDGDGDDEDDHDDAGDADDDGDRR